MRGRQARSEPISVSGRDARCKRRQGAGCSQSPQAPRFTGVVVSGSTQKPAQRLSGWGRSAATVGRGVSGDARQAPGVGGKDDVAHSGGQFHGDDQARAASSGGTAAVGLLAVPGKVGHWSTSRRAAASISAAADDRSQARAARCRYWCRRRPARRC